MPALRLYAGPRARAHIASHGLQASDVRAIPAAAGGPKGLILGPLDRFLFAHWLLQSHQPIDLVGASIGAWRMATACLDDCETAFRRLEHDYIRQHYALQPGEKRPPPERVSERFGEGLRAFYGGRIGEVLQHPRWRLHVVTSRGRHLLRREHPVGTPLGYLGAYLSNAVHRRALGAWLERVVFSVPDAQGRASTLPFGTQDFRTRQVLLDAQNFQPALQASCSIPFVLRSVQHIPGAPAGAYWDGGITDYHLHLDWRRCAPPGIVLYPHFQKAVVPGWLDKALRWRHPASAFLDSMLVVAPDPQWVRGLPNGKLPDRTDFTRYGNDLSARVAAWSAAVGAAQALADEFAEWLQHPDPSRVEAL